MRLAWARIFLYCLNELTKQNKPNTIYNQEECEQWLNSDLQRIKKQVEPLIKVKINNLTQAAIYSFVYNAGIGNFQRSTLLKKLNIGDLDGACEAMKQWVYVGKEKWQGLMTRRNIESAICTRQYMKLNSLPFFIAILASTSLVVLYNYYAQLKYQYNQLVEELDKQTELKNSYLKEVKLLHQLDTKRTQELSYAKAEISKLTDDLHNGTKRLYVKAVCAKADSITTTTSVDDARPTELAPDARRNYLRLRHQLETLEAQYLGLRERVKEIYKQKNK